MKLYIDMDGVLADFDRRYEEVFKVRPSKEKDDVDWDKVRSVPGFYFGIPPMADARELWDYVRKHDPVILTGVPQRVEEAADNKISWVHRHIGNVQVICCRSREKSLHCRVGDVLVDDWERYRSRWEAAGGLWVTHTSARETIEKLKEMGL